MFYETVLASALFSAVACWGDSIKARRVGTVVEWVVEVAKEKNGLRSTYSNHPILPICSKEQLK